MSSVNIFEPKFFSPKMEALQLDPKRHALSFGSTDVPAITKSDDVIVRVAFSGVCGTDLHVIRGDYPCSKQTFILGHEFCGVVYAFGSEVKQFKRGSRVAIDPNKGCELCKYCHTGSYHLCPSGSINSAIGIFYNGGWAQFCKVSAKQVYLLPSNISFKQAVLLEPLSCIHHGFSRLLPIDVGKTILIAGSGIIGTLWCCLLHHSGHRKVFVIETSDDRRKLFKNLDTGFTIGSEEEIHNIFKKDGEFGIDVCIDCSGNGSAIEKNFTYLNRSGKLCIFGVASPETKISISPFDIFIKELSIYGVTVNPYAFESAIGLMEAMGPRYFDYDLLGIKVYSMSQYKDAIDALQERKILKAVFSISSELRQ